MPKPGLSTKNESGGIVFDYSKTPMKVILWSNGMVMAFNRDGNQIPEFQGPFLEIRQKILDAAVKGTEFEIGAWRQGTVSTTRECFASTGWGVKAPSADG